MLLVPSVFCRVTTANRLLLPVHPQVEQPGRRVPTPAALVRLLVGVHPLVPNVGGGEAKGLAAGTAFVGPLPGVRASVQRCSVSAEPWLKALPQSLHRKGLSPVWIFWCSSREDTWLKAAPHSGHL